VSPRPAGVHVVGIVLAGWRPVAWHLSGVPGRRPCWLPCTGYCRRYGRHLGAAGATKPNASRRFTTRPGAPVRSWLGHGTLRADHSALHRGWCCWARCTVRNATSRPNCGWASLTENRDPSAICSWGSPVAPGYWLVACIWRTGNGRPGASRIKLPAHEQGQMRGDLHIGRLFAALCAANY